MATWPALQITFREDSDLPDSVQAALLDFNVTAIDEGEIGRTPAVWRVYFGDAPTREDAARMLRAAFDHDALALMSIDVEDEDWAARSQASLRAIQAGRIIVAPPWDIPLPTSVPSGKPPSLFERDGGCVVIVIQPSMGFGTGHHQTTRLCLLALQRLDLNGASVIDVGTGSGVLAIAAKRLGARQVLGIDDDEHAIESARENLALNGGVDVTLGVMDLRRASLRPFDVVVANLTGGLLTATAATLQALCGGRLILSGFLLSERTDVRKAFEQYSVEHEDTEDEWGCMTLRPSG
jgi:ribosomal protein L11 methyltransferase